MLKRLRVQNFRCIEDLSITFEPLTVLVGANGTGKSSILHLLTSNLVRADDIRLRRPGTRVDIEFEFDDERRVARSGAGPNEKFAQPLASQLLRLELNRLRAEQQTSKRTRITTDGVELVNVFASLGRPGEERVARELCTLVPIFSDVDHEPTTAGNERLVFRDRWKSDVIYDPTQVSDGTMLVLAYLLIRHQQPAPELIAIEEPERGLHPYLLGQIVDLLRKLARGELGGKPVQVVLATHSAELLDHVEPQEVRFLSRRSDDGAVVVETAPTDAPNWRDVFREHENSLGGLWLSGGLGGVPGN